MLAGTYKGEDIATVHHWSMIITKSAFNRSFTFMNLVVLVGWFPSWWSGHSCFSGWSQFSDQSPLLAEEDVTIVLAEGWVGPPRRVNESFSWSWRVGGSPSLSDNPRNWIWKARGNFCVRFNLQSTNIPWNDFDQTLKWCAWITACSPDSCCSRSTFSSSGLSHPPPSTPYLIFVFRYFWQISWGKEFAIFFCLFSLKCRRWIIWNLQQEVFQPFAFSMI